MKNIVIGSTSDKLMPVKVQDAVKAKFALSTEKDLKAVYKNEEWDIYTADERYLVSFDSEGNEC